MTQVIDQGALAPKELLINLQSVSKRFPVDTSLTAALRARLTGKPPRSLTAVEDASLSIQCGEVVGLVGESGCGKSTLGRLVSAAFAPTSGQVYYRGRDTQNLGRKERRDMLRRVQTIFQDPYASLNPRMRVRDLIAEAPVFHGLVPRADADGFMADILRRVELDPSHADRYPHQFSGGQRQRIGIARALALEPDLIVCDESVASLDVSIQAQIINLLIKLRAEVGLAMLFISHDLRVVEHLADRIVVMYLGRIVEKAPSEALFDQPKHPYTQALLREIPRLRDRNRRFATIKGDIPSPIDPPGGCHFHNRCPFATEICSKVRPPLRDAGTNRSVACHHSDPLPTNRIFDP